MKGEARVEAFGSISSTRGDGPVKNLIAKALLERILSAAESQSKFKVSEKIK